MQADDRSDAMAMPAFACGLGNERLTGFNRVRAGDWAAVKPRLKDGSVLAHIDIPTYGRACLTVGAEGFHLVIFLRRDVKIGPGVVHGRFFLGALPSRRSLAIRSARAR